MKLNLLKKLLTLSPVVISPILVTACGNSSNDGDTNFQFYIDFYQKELNTIWATKAADINNAALNVNHNYNLKTEILDKVLAKVKADGKNEYKKDSPNNGEYQSDVFNDITTVFSVPDGSKGNLNVTDDTSLSVYPSGIGAVTPKKEQLNYVLKLKTKSIYKTSEGTLNLDLKAGFVNYSTKSSGEEKLASDDIVSTFGSSDMSGILVGTKASGLNIGTRQAGGGYKFVNYSTKSAGKEKLANDDIKAVFGNSDLSTILVGEAGGGLDVGTRQGYGSYNFTNYSTSNGLKNNNVYALYGNASLSKILVGEANNGGLDVGTRSGSSYSFKNYPTRLGASTNIQSLSGNDSLSTILLGTNKGLDVGSNADGAYQFITYDTSSASIAKLASDNVTGVFGNEDMSNILVGEDGGGLDFGTFDSDRYLSFTNYNASSSGKKKLISNYVKSVFANPDLSTILVGTNQGLDIGTKAKASDPYSFTKYDSTNGLSGSFVTNISGTTDLSAILLGEQGSGLDISSNLWFA